MIPIWLQLGGQLGALDAIGVTAYGNGASTRLKDMANASCRQVVGRLLRRAPRHQTRAGLLIGGFAKEVLPEYPLAWPDRREANGNLFGVGASPSPRGPAISRSWHRWSSWGAGGVAALNGGRTGRAVGGAGNTPIQIAIRQVIAVSGEKRIRRPRTLRPRLPLMCARLTLMADYKHIWFGSIAHRQSSTNFLLWRSFRRG